MDKSPLAEDTPKASRGPSPPQPPAVPPPSTVNSNTAYSTLVTTPAGSKDNYFPAAPVSRGPASSQQDSPPQPTSSSTKPSADASSCTNRDIASETSKEHSLDTSVKDVRQPGAADALRAKLAEHRKSMSAAYDEEHPSRVKDYAFTSRSRDNTGEIDKKTPPLVRNATFDQTLSQDVRRPLEGGQRLLQKSHSIMTPQKHIPEASTSTSTAPPLPSTVSEIQEPKLPVGLAAGEHHAPGRLPDIVTAIDPSTTKKASPAGQPVPKLELEEAISNPKKPFYKRPFGTRRRLLGARGMPSQTGSTTSVNRFSAGPPRPGLKTNALGTGSMASAVNGPASVTAGGGGGFSLGGAAPHKPSMARQRTKAPPVGVAIPNTQRKREPTWSKKARERPLYSLGKPLPTHEEVQAQRAWQEQVERLKELYPEAEPPEPPPLPSQQAAGAITSGLQIDKAQLKNIIRTAIMEYKKYEAGELDLDAVSAISPTSPSIASTRRRRSTLMSEGSTASPHRRTFGSVNATPRAFGLPRMDSAVIDEEDGPPLEPLHLRASGSMLDVPPSGRKASKAESMDRGPPAVANRDGQELHRGSMPSRGQRQAREPSRISRGGRPSTITQSGAGMPANTEEPLTDEDVAQKAEEEKGANQTDGGHSIAKNSIYSRDHETEGNWSEEEATELDSDEAANNQGFVNEQDAEYEDDEYDDDYPNIIAKWRAYAREPLAEFLGAFVLAVIGVGASAQAALSSDPNIQPTGTGAAATSVNLSAPLAWGAGVAMSVYIAGGISGGHISPAITIVLAVFRGFPWKRVPSYIAGQLLGFIGGSGVAYGLYRHAITIYEGGPDVRTIGVGGTANFFATYPMEYVSNANAFFQEFTNVALLIILVLAIGDADNVPPPAGLNPIIIMFMIMAIGLSLGLQSSYALNPARDLGPRLVSWWAGYGTGVWNYRDQYWLWCPWAADITGGLFGALMYDTLIFMGRESPMNKRWHMPFVNKTKKSEEMSRRWQGWKLHQKARRAGWRSRLVPEKDAPAEAKEVV